MTGNFWRVETMVALAGPHGEQRGALEEEAIPEGRGSETVEQALGAETDQDLLERDAGAPCQVQQPGADGCGRIAQLAPRQVSDSR
jgi:hypothetical protein